jgi:hypothetical protein
VKKKDELSDPNSCFNKAGDDDMLFILLGKDHAAPAAVLAWIEERVRIERNLPDDPKLTEARQWAERALEGRKG